MMRYFLPLLLVVAALSCGCAPPRGGGLGGPDRKAELKYPAAPPGSRPAPAAADTAGWLNRTMNELKAKLKLTPAQADKVRAILKDGMDQKERLRPEGDRYGSIQEMNKLFARMRQVDRATEAALAKVLSADQMASYRAYLKQERKRLGEGRAPAAAPRTRERRPQ